MADRTRPVPARRRLDQRTLVRHGLVLVTIDYAWAHWDFSRVPRWPASRRHASHNYGLMDQIAALEWVRKNIAAFGGIRSV